MKFTEFNLDQKLLQGIEEAGFTECLDVQSKTFEQSLKKRDVYVQSQTGTGKTAAFLITIFDLFLRKEFHKNKALIIVPTRELAVQIEREARKLAAHLSFRIGSFFGGVGYNEQKAMLKNGVEIIIGTPGRLIDLNQSHNLDFRDTSILVIDEADRLFDMGFLPDLRRMLRRMPHRNDRLTMLFSATLNTRVWQVAWEHMSNPAEIIMNPEKMTVDEITQELYHVSKAEKLRLLLGLLKREQPESTLIFSNTKIGAVEISQRLSHNGYPCEFIIGDLPQRKRIRVIDGLKSGTIRCLVATDVAARGLHVNDLDLVVNYDIPEDPELYVHRIGRTARAGKSGKAISLACERFVYGLESIEDLIKMKIPVMWPDESLFEEDKSAGIHFGKERYSRASQGRGNRHHARSGQRSRNTRHPRSGRHAHGGQHSQAGQQRGGQHPQGAQRSGGGKQQSGGPQNAHGGQHSQAGQQRGGQRSQNAQRPDGTRQHQSRTGRQTGDGSTGPNRTANPPKKSDSAKKSRPTQTPPRSESMDDRLKYYKEKYGEEFRPADKPDTPSVEPNASAQKKEARAPKTRKGTKKRADAPSSFFKRLRKRKSKSSD